MSWWGPAGMAIAKKLGQAIGNYFDGGSSAGGSGGIPVLAGGKFCGLRWVAIRAEHLPAVLATYPDAISGADFCRCVTRWWGTDPGRARRLQPLVDEMAELFERFDRACCFVVFPPD